MTDNWRQERYKTSGFNSTSGNKLLFIVQPYGDEPPFSNSI